MNRLEPDVVEYYDQEAVRMICEKYGMQPMEALRTVVCSKTHEMLENADMGMTDFGAGALFDMWECEQITGDPRRSVYIRLGD